jgi:hypothetical protein
VRCLPVVPALRGGEVGEKFGCGLNARNKQPVAGAGAGDVEQVVLGVVNLIEFRFVGDGLNRPRALPVSLASLN